MYSNGVQPKIDSVRSLLLVQDSCLVIPPYQRPYEWTRDRWQSLIKDIVEALTNQKGDHFIGVAITTESKPDCHLAHNKLLHRHIDIIDGQQRLLTLRVWLQAVLDHSKDLGNPLNIEFSNINCQETDIEAWEAVTKGQWVKKYQNYSAEQSGLLHAYTYFRWILWLGQNAMMEQEPEELPKLGRNQNTFGSFSDLEKFWIESLEKRAHKIEASYAALQVQKSQSVPSESLVQSTVNQLKLLVLELSVEDEEPAEIFNALNGQRSEMTQFDHLRNFIFAQINSEQDRTQLYENKWKHVERQVAKLKIPVKGSSAFDTFIYDLLISMGEKKFQSISKDKTARQFARFYNSSRNVLTAKQVAESLVLPNLVSWASIKKSGKTIEVNSNTYELPENIQSSLVLMEWLSSGPVAPLILSVVNKHYFQHLDQYEFQKSIYSIENHSG